MSLIKRAYKSELALNNKQLTACKRHAGAARWAYNWLRHEVAFVAVETGSPGLNLVVCHQYPSGTCV
jgi:Helix-turn-helix domain